MLPGGIVAAAFLLSLIPGWWFLRRTESARRPRHLSPLQEVLELVGVGLATTGGAVALAVLVCPNLILSRDSPPETSGELRIDILLVVGALALALGLAEAGARVVSHFDKTPTSEFSIGVWWSVLKPDQVPAGHVPHVAIGLTNGSTVDGVLHNYTWMPDVTHRDISLRAPIRFTEDGKEQPTEYKYLIVPGDQIEHVAVQYQPKSPSL